MKALVATAARTRIVVMSGRTGWALPPLLYLTLSYVTASAAAAQSCPPLSGVFSATLVGVTTGSSADAGSCGGGSAPEATYFYYAPRTGTYTIDTIGSDFDTV